MKCFSSYKNFLPDTMLASRYITSPSIKYGLSTTVSTRSAATRTWAPRRRTMVPNKHWNPLFRKERNWKVLKIDLVDHEFDRRRAREEITPEEIKERMKKLGVEPPSQYAEKPLYISSTGAILEAYVPPEGDGKVS